MRLVSLDETANLSQFILDYSCCSFLNDEAILDEFSTWLLENENKVVLVFDGLDQMASLELTTNFKTSLEANQTSKQWISAILARKVLSNCKLILTSRPYALCSLDGDFTADCSLSLEGFLIENLESVLAFYLNKTETEKLFVLLKNKRLVKLATNPNSAFLLIKMFEEGFKFNVDDITDTSLYNNVFESMIETKSFSVENSKDKMRKLECVCFKLIKNKKFIIEEGDLENKLTLKDVERLIPVKAQVVKNAYNSAQREKVVKINHQHSLVSFLLIHIH